MKNKLLKIILMLLILWGGYVVTSNATISAETKTVNSGESVVIKVTSNEKVGAYKLTVIDSGGATFQSVVAPEGATAGGTTVTGASTSGVTTLGTYTFKMPTVSSEQKYIIKFSATGMETPNLEEIKDSGANATITVKPISKPNDNNNNDNKNNDNNNNDNKNNDNNNNDNNNNDNNNNDNNNNDNNNKNNEIPKETNPVDNTITKSSNNYLSTLKVNKGTLSPKFNFRTYKYTVDVGEEVESIKITASAEHNKAKVSGTGTKKLEPGENTIDIKVTAEDGKVRTYTVVVSKPKQEEKVILKSLVIKGINKEEKIDFTLTPEFSSEVYEYSLTIPKEQHDITKLDIEAIGDKEEFTIEVTGNEELVDGENTVKIIVKSKDGEKTTEYIIKVNKEEKVIETVTIPVKDVTPNTGYEDNSKQIIKITITGFTTLIAVAGIIFAVIEYKYGNKNEDDEEDNEVETVSFASVGFENEDNHKEDILENLRETEATKIEEKFNDNEEKKIDTESISTSQKTERTSRRSKAKRAKIKDEEFEDVEETFEVLKEENTVSRKRGKHF